jgi:peptide/nickel transport system permease protein
VSIDGDRSALPARPQPPSAWARWWGVRPRLRGFLGKVGVLLSFGWLLLTIVSALFAPLIAPHDPNAQNLSAPSAGISASHWLGTDDLGRDVLSRLIYGSRISMQVTFETVGLALLVALLIGLIAGFRGGWIDYLLMRGTDAGMAFPPLVLALAVVAVLGSNVNDISLALALVFSPGFARFIRGQTLAVKEESFVEASTAIGSPSVRIVVVRILPNVMTGLVVGIAIALGSALLAESGLSFLGLGPPPPAASWGSMLKEAYDIDLFTHPWSLVPAGLAITLTVLSFNTIGDALRDTLAGSVRRTGRRTSRQRGITAVDRRLSEEAVNGAHAPAPISMAQTSAVVPGPVLEIRDLTIEFDGASGPARVVDRVSFDVAPGQIVGLVGESGCGKTVTSLAILRLLPSPPARIVSGSIRFDGRDTLTMGFDELRRIRGRDIAMVFQDPLASLDPSFTVGYQLVEAVRLHEKISRKAARDRAARLLESVHIPDPVRRLSAYPHQLSGGMRQRVMIAMALSCSPRLLIADEPTTSLDVTVQAQIVELLHELREKEGLAVLFVTHDLALISELSDEIVVMYAGQVVEQAPTTELFAHPLQPYTAALLAATPGSDTARTEVGRTLFSGQVPQAGRFPEGCRFHPRCTFAEDQCGRDEVELEVVDGNRKCRCLRRAELSLPGVGEAGQHTLIERVDAP